jgi:hypothetical protein
MHDDRLDLALNISHNPHCLQDEKTAGVVVSAGNPSSAEMRPIVACGAGMDELPHVLLIPPWRFGNQLSQRKDRGKIAPIQWTNADRKRFAHGALVFCPVVGVAGSA